MIVNLEDMKKSRFDNYKLAHDIQSDYRNTSITKKALLRKYKITEIQLIEVLKVDLNELIKKGSK